jgi:hypothetical protein
VRMAMAPDVRGGERFNALPHLAAHQDSVRVITRLCAQCVNAGCVAAAGEGARFKGCCRDSDRELSM